MQAAQCRYARFDINLDMPDYAYPVTFIQNGNRLWTNKPGYVAVMVINAIYDLINYLIFILVHLCVDLVLIKKMRRVLREKEEKMREMNSQGMEKMLKENKESKRRLILMVIYSSLLNFITKVPSIITSLNDVRILAELHTILSKLNIIWFDLNFVTTLSFRYFCQSEGSCLIFQKLSNSLFLLSLCLTLTFLKKFDKNFEEAFQHVFSKKTKQSM